MLVAGAVWIVYGRALDTPFVFDDEASVIKNSSITRVWPLFGESDNPGPLNPPKETTTSGRPLVNLSLALNYRFGGLNPVGYHLFNLIVHVLSALLLMAIVQRTLCLDFFEGRFERASQPLGLAVALLWALHPLQTETVVYVTQRTELMVGFFYLATIYGSLRYWAAGSAVVRKTWLALATLACLAGMASKEVMVTAPVIVLLFERTFIAGSFRRALRNSWPLYVGLFLSWGLLLYLNYNAPRSESAGFHLAVPATAWWLTQTKVLLMYLKLAVWPWPLSIHYEMPYFTSVSAAWPWLAAVALMGVGTLILFWRRSAIGFVGAWVFLILSPTLVVPIVTEMAAERRMYLPMAALVTLVVVVGYRLAVYATSSRRWLATIVGAVAVLLTLVCGVVSAKRLTAYQSELTLWQDTVLHQPEDSVAHYNLGEELARAGRTPDAIEEFRAALNLRPNYPDAQNNLGLALANTGQLEEAIQHYQEALRLNPGHADAHNNLGNALSNAGHLQEAIEHYKQALALNPKHATAHYNLGVALTRSGQLEDAIQHYRNRDQSQPAVHPSVSESGAGYWPNSITPLKPLPWLKKR